jgi:hypothetical protein
MEVVGRTSSDYCHKASDICQALSIVIGGHGRWQFVAAAVLGFV